MFLNFINISYCHIIKCIEAVGGHVKQSPPAEPNVLLCFGSSLS